MVYKEKHIQKYKGWDIKQIDSGKAKGVYFAEKVIPSKKQKFHHVEEYDTVSFGILGDNSVSAIKKEINRRKE